MSFPTGNMDVILSRRLLRGVSTGFLCFPGVSYKRRLSAKSRYWSVSIRIPHSFSQLCKEYFTDNDRISVFKSPFVPMHIYFLRLQLTTSQGPTVSSQFSFIIRVSNDPQGHCADLLLVPQQFVSKESTVVGCKLSGISWTRYVKYTSPKFLSLSE